MIDLVRLDLVTQQHSLNDEISSLSSMGLVRLKIRELSEKRGWSLKEVSDRSGVVYSTLRTYARSSGMAMVDATALLKLARTFEVAIEELIEVVEE